MKRKKPRPRKDMLTQGNTHLGDDIHAFSIPAFSTCPGATLACLLVCYALNFRFMRSTVREKYQDNWERAKDYDAFAEDIILEIRWKRISILRIHVAGNFFADAYVRAWIKVARTCKRTTFLFYTRSWRVEAMRASLIELASLPNVYAFWSEDRDTGVADMPVGRRCFLVVDPEDEALVPPGVLVFRDKPKTALKWINGSWVCAKEQGIANGITCSSCLRCLRHDPWPVPPGERA